MHFMIQLTSESFTIKEAILALRGNAYVLKWSVRKLDEI
ncbi:hypothetical protein X975_03778, partial [Stegodyphus mimosarum]